MRRVKPAMTQIVPMLVAVALPAPLAAQERPTAPDSVPSREQVQRPAPATGRADGTRVRVDATGLTDAAPCPLDESTVRARIERVRFVSADGRPLPGGVVRELAGIGITAPGEQPIAIVCRVRDTAAGALRRAGYIASVQIPPQEIKDGELTLTVVLARITEVRVRGEAGPHRTALLARVAQLQALDPLNPRAHCRFVERAGRGVGQAGGVDADAGAIGAPGRGGGTLHLFAAGNAVRRGDRRHHHRAAPVRGAGERAELRIAADRARDSLSARRNLWPADRVRHRLSRRIVDARFP